MFSYEMLDRWSAAAANWCRVLPPALLLHAVCNTVGALTRGAWSGRPWGWVQRLAVWGLVAQVGVAAAPLVAPWLQVSVVGAAMLELLLQASGLGALTGSSRLGSLFLQVLLTGCTWCATPYSGPGAAHQGTGSQPGGAITDQLDNMQGCSSLCRPTCCRSVEAESGNRSSRSSGDVCGGGRFHQEGAASAVADRQDNQCQRHSVVTTKSGNSPVQHAAEGQPAVLGGTTPPGGSREGPNHGSSHPPPTSSSCSPGASRRTSSEEAADLFDGGIDPEASQLVAEQWMVCDTWQTLVSVLITATDGYKMVQAGLQPGVTTSTTARALGITLSMLHMASQVPIVAYMLWRPKAAIAGRSQLWVCASTVPTFLAHLAATLLNRSVPHSMRLGLILLATGLGVVDVSVGAFIQWLRINIPFLYTLYARKQWGSMSWWSRGWLAVEFNLLPIACYAFARPAANWLRHAMVGKVWLLFKLLGADTGSSKRQRLFRVAAAVLTQQLVCGVLVSSLYSTASHYEGDVGTHGLLALLPSGILQACLQVVVPGATIVACLLVAPALQLVLMLAAAYLQQGPQQISPLHTTTAAQQPRHACTTSTASPQQQGRLAEALLALTAVLGEAGQAAALLPLRQQPGVAAWQKALAAVVLCLPAASSLAYTVMRWPLPTATPSAVRRQLVWVWCGLAAPCLQQVAVAAALRQSPMHGLLLVLLRQAALCGALNMEQLWFAAWLPLVAGGCCGISVWRHLALSTRPWGLLALDALEYGLYPVVMFHACNWGAGVVFRAEAHLLHKAVQAFPSAVGSSWCPSAATLAAAAGLQVWCGALGCLQWVPPAASEHAKAWLHEVVMHLRLQTTSVQSPLHTAAAVLSTSTCLLVVLGLQALILANPAFANPRRRWYEGAKAGVMSLGVATMGRLAVLGTEATSERMMQELLDSLRCVTEGCFSGCSLLLVLLGEEGLRSPTATRHLVRAAPEAAALPAATQLPLRELESVQVAVQTGKPTWRAGLSAEAIGYLDWQVLHQVCCMDSFLVVPLSCGNRGLGALLVTAITPVTLDSYQRRLAGDLGAVLSQVLYTLSCINTMKAGNQIIQDMLPQQVATQLQRRLLRHTSSHQRRWNGGQALEPQEQTTTHRFSVAGHDPAILQSAVSTAQGVAYRQWHPHVTVLFADIVGFPALITEVESEQVMQLLHELFSKYDRLCKQYGVYKVETVGDCYMACAGVLSEDPDHALHVVQLGRAMLATAAAVLHPLGGHIHIRVGAHSGRVMSGVVGCIRARYCLFGDTVNTASRMQSTCVTDRLQVSAATHALLGHKQLDFEVREAVAVKGKGLMTTYLLKQSRVIGSNH